MYLVCRVESHIKAASTAAACEPVSPLACTIRCIARGSGPHHDVTGQHHDVPLLVVSWPATWCCYSAAAPCRQSRLPDAALNAHQVSSFHALNILVPFSNQPGSGVGGRPLLPRGAVLNANRRRRVAAAAGPGRTLVAAGALPAPRRRLGGSGQWQRPWRTAARAGMEQALRIRGLKVYILEPFLRRNSAVGALQPEQM